ncbi:hypothetical protein PFISCL1PPCAC_20334 [Pristionchus fissidentatus]|uniref:Transmembrane protein 230 n=1 Tax=Pristionchus fissidentatus TaxID=1538716 RepID=A0AAV5WGG4_9BILA|nr:hypothetical protein PFISCL1PPCAC_20334 [Pristionchus fissidentatus]
MKMVRHTRTQSAVQQLIVDRKNSRDEEEEDVEKGEANVEEIPETSGVFPTGPSPQEESPRAAIHDAQRRKTRWSQLWNNRKSVLLAVVLFFAGTGEFTLLVVSKAFSTVSSSYIGWWLLFPGIIAFLPGSYHCFYILCIIMGRDGYDLDKLPTFKR